MLLQVLQEDAGIKSQRLITDTTDYWEETSPTNLQIVCPNWTVEKFIDVYFDKHGKEHLNLFNNKKSGVKPRFFLNKLNS